MSGPGGQMSDQRRCLGILVCAVGDKLSSAAAKRWMHRGVQ